MKPQSAEALLAHLVSHPTVVGTSNLDLVGFVADYLRGHGAAVSVLVGPEGDRANLFATLGDPGLPGYILSGHLDVVPAEEPEWRGDPFSLRQSDDRLIARGACDMKGFDAAVLAAVPDLAAMTLTAPIHIALSYDEEAGCKGVPHMIAQLPDLCAPPLGCIVGEPTGLQPVLAHKGKAALRLTAKGVPGHSSRPDKGKNAIHALVPALTAAVELSGQLEQTGQDDRFEPPWSTLQIGTVQGGTAVNIIPDHAQTLIETRAIAGADPRALLAPVCAAAGDMVETEWVSTYPALALEAGAPLAALAAEISGKSPLQAVSFGTEAGLFQAAGIPSVICGPGDIARAHRPEEYLTRQELEDTRQMILRLGQRLGQSQ
ncbi:acetylornithine deacetylase [Tropicibacter sp. R15_0]|uniref:acetylornithine deacetylase n=1 Tax=Tropicibacter sp. R15_0 TaxID=2821101 RepID=UPI001ADBCDD7|nr:acetylornithine deacetylase [Tropicibacter sp. R15_0]MBO9467813.1 acetylornithine deacetylase [Tropicibacter sp. R15_0]